MKGNNLGKRNLRILIGAIMLVAFISPVSIRSQCNATTKGKIEALKESIPYPRFNIGDIVYIAFIKDIRIDINNLRETDLIVEKVRIEDMALYNGLEVVDDELQYGLYMSRLMDSDHMEWSYRFLDTTIVDPKYGDMSGFYSEDRFAQTPSEAKRKLLDSHN